MASPNALYIRMAHSLRHGNPLFSLIFALFVGFVLSACGGDDTEPLPPTDGQVATTDGQAGLPACKLELAEIGATASYTSNGAAIEVTGHTEPDASIKLSYKTYSSEVQTTSKGWFKVRTAFPAEELDLSVVAVLSVSKATCRTKSIDLHFVPLRQ